MLEKLKKYVKEATKKVETREQMTKQGWQLKSDIDSGGTEFIVEEERTVKGEKWCRGRLLGVDEHKATKQRGK